MFWLFAAVVLVLMVSNQGFRKFALGLAYWLFAIGVAALAAAYANEPNNSRQAFIWTMIGFWLLWGAYRHVTRRKDEFGRPIRME